MTEEKFIDQQIASLKTTLLANFLKRREIDRSITEQVLKLESLERIKATSACHRRAFTATIEEVTIGS